MTKRRPIREKLMLGGLLVGIMVAALSASSFLGIYSYRRLVRALSCRAAELPRASELGECVSLLRLAHLRAGVGNRHLLAAASPLVVIPPADTSEDMDATEPLCSASFADQLARTGWALDRYCAELSAGEIGDVPFGDRSRERNTAMHIASVLELRRVTLPGLRHLLAALQAKEVRGVGRGGPCAARDVGAGSPAASTTRGVASVHTPPHGHPHPPPPLCSASSRTSSRSAARTRRTRRR